jgi:hypothetical protein
MQGGVTLATLALQARFMIIMLQAIDHRLRINNLKP